MNAWVPWLRRTTNRASARAIATRIGHSHTAVARWSRGSTPPCDVVIEIARAYDADPIEALIAAGWLTPEDLHRHTVRATVRRAPSVYLASELLARTSAWEKAVRDGTAYKSPAPVASDLDEYL